MQMKKFVLLALVALSIVSNGFTKSKKDNLYDEKIESLIKQLTIEEKVGMIHGSGMFTNGGVPRLGIPELMMSDGPCGVRMEINRDNWGSPNWTNDNGTYFPAQTALAATWDTALSRVFGTSLGQESKIRGKDIQLAPGINIIRSPLCGRNWEYMSEDPFLISKLVVPVIQGIQSNKGVAACIKHYALNNQETERGTIDVYVGERPLREIYLRGFEAGFKDGKVLTAMGAYNKFRGQHATYNKHLIMDILKGEWGFKGIIISDWDACHNTIEAAKYGLDIEMGTDGKKFDDYYMAKPLLDSIKAGKVDIKDIDDKVRRILYTIFSLNIINRPAFDTTGMYAKQAIPQRIAASRKVAEESVVLLKNTNKFLPFDFSKIKSIAIIGDNAKREHAIGGGSTTIKARYEISPYEALVKNFEGKVKINYALGYYAPEVFWVVDKLLNNQDDRLLQEAVEAASKSDVVLYFGGLNHNQGNDSEGADRPDMKMPYGQDKLLEALVKVNPNIVVVVLAGTPVEIGNWFNAAPAVLHTSYLGMEAGNIILDVISGKVNPSGKLAMTFPKKLEDSPAHAVGEFPGKNGKVNYTEGLLVGYRYFDAKNIEPMFPFGYGLSYTSYEYSNLLLPKSIKSSANTIDVKFELSNTGSLDGKEISQLYVRQMNSKYERPLKELKGFSKVGLKAGEKKQVVVTVNKNDLKIFDETTNKWILEPGSIEIMIGSSSKDIKLKGEVSIQ
jgi:beta-glucosidase